MITKSQLDSFVGQTISDICPNKFHDNSANHCAHFVSHVLNLHFGYDCKQHKGGTQPMSQFLFHYKGQTNSMWHGTLPPGARAISFQQC